MEYNEFLNQVLKKSQSKKCKVRNSFGIYDCYKYIRKNQWYNIGRPLKEHEFYSIIRSVNVLLADGLANGNDIHFPHGMGVLEVRKFPRGVKIIDGKLVNTYPVDWNKTLKLWYEDEEAKNNKAVIRFENDYIYQVLYNKYKANYGNLCFYEFDLNRFIKVALRDNINKGKIDSLW